MFAAIAGTIPPNPSIFLHCPTATMRKAKPAAQMVVRQEYRGGWPLGFTTAACPAETPVGCRWISTYNLNCCPSGQFCFGTQQPYCCPTGTPRSRLILLCPYISWLINWGSIRPIQMTIAGRLSRTFLFVRTAFGPCSTTKRLGVATFVARAVTSELSPRGANRASASATM